MSGLRSYNQNEFDPATLPYQTFNELLLSHAENESLFVRFYDTGKLKSKLSYSEFYQKVMNFSEVVLNAANGAESVAVAMENSIEALISFSAVMNLGLTLIPVDPLQQEEYYKKISSQFNCNLVIAPEGHSSHKIFKQSCCYLETSNSTKIIPPAASSIIFTSSGTTGIPKGIVQTYSSLMVNTIATIKVHALNKESRHFCILPLFHVNAFSFSFITTLTNGNELILNKNFSQPSFWETVNSTEPQIVSAIPPVLRLLTEDPRDVLPSTSIKYFVSAASNLGKKTLMDFYHKFNIPVIQAYGLSETVNFSATFPTNLDKSDYESILALDEKTSIGTEVWGNNIFILDEHDEVVTSEKSEGELAVRGWNIMNQYYHSEAATAKAFAHDFFHTGDIGYFRIVNGNKFFYLNGRKKEVAKVNGKIVFLNEIDDLILNCPYINSACAVCFLDENQEEQLGVYLSVTMDKSAAEIKSDLKKILPPQVLLKKIIIGSDILMTPSGKKRRSEMAKLYFDERSST